MAKREAGNYLTDQNWDQEQETTEEVMILFKTKNKNYYMYLSFPIEHFKIINFPFAMFIFTSASLENV